MIPYDIEKAFTDFITDNWTATSIRLVNIDSTPALPFIDIYCNLGGMFPLEINGHANRTGVLTINIFTQKGVGVQECLTYSGILEHLFWHRIIDDIVCDPPHTNIIGIDTALQAYHTQTIIPFSIITDLSISELWCKTYDDADLSGTPLIVRSVDNNGNKFFQKVYPVISELVGGSIENALTGIMGIEDANIAGDISVAFMRSVGGVSFFYKIYADISVANKLSDGDDIRPTIFDNANILGQARVAEIEINNIKHYFKVYPTKE